MTGISPLAMTDFTAVSAQELLAEYTDFWTTQIVFLCSPDRPHQHRDKTCEQPGKVPVVQGWQRLPDERRQLGIAAEAIAQEAAAHLSRGGNIGLAVPRDVVALDADSSTSAARLAAACPDAPFQKTGRGGHALLGLPESVPITNTCAVRLSEHLEVDLRGHGSQIVVWPSRHHSGVEYVWTTALPSDPNHLPLAPACWLEIFAQHDRGHARRSPEQWRELAANGVTEGARHSSLLSIAGKVFASSLDPKIGYQLLHAWNRDRCDPPLEHDEADAAIRDIAAKEANRRRRRSS